MFPFCQLQTACAWCLLQKQARIALDSLDYYFCGLIVFLRSLPSAEECDTKMGRLQREEVRHDEKIGKLHQDPGDAQR